MSNKKEKNSLDLNDPKIREILHSEEKIESEAKKSAAGAVALAGASVALETGLIMHDIGVKPSVSGFKSFLNTVRQSKFLTTMAVLPAVMLAAGGIWSYFKTKSTLHEKKEELEKVEAAEAVAASAHPTQPKESPELQAANNEKSWVERSAKSITAPSISR